MMLVDLDCVIQVVMGWINSYFYQFGINGIFYGIFDDEWFDDMFVFFDVVYSLDEVLGILIEGFVYQYDFGDSWNYDVIVQGVEVVDEKCNGWFMCFVGVNVCLLEDVGGFSGYEDFLWVMRDLFYLEYDVMC